MNVAAVTINTNLIRSRLMPVAERAAKREGLMLAQVITIGGEVTRGHRALWRALAGEGLSATDLSAILGWSASVIAKELTSVPAPPPSGVRAVRKPRVKAPPGSLEAQIERAVTAALAPVLAKLDLLLRPEDRPPQPTPASAWLDAHGRYGAMVREVALEHSMAVDRLLGRARGKNVTAARVAVVAKLTDAGLSQIEIGRILRCDHTSVHYLQRKGGVAPAFEQNARKAAA